MACCDVAAGSKRRLSDDESSRDTDASSNHEFAPGLAERVKKRKKKVSYVV